MMRLTVDFFCSALSLADCPRWERREIAVAGRSNVGKSSLLNALAGRKNLARVSKTPGRTRALNFFVLKNQLALVDLPGYGYAKISRDQAGKIARLMEDYLHRRANLALVILLVDARRGLEEEEAIIATMVKNAGHELLLVATKCDKLARAERDAAMHRFRQSGRVPVMCSALSAEGIEQLRRRILDLTSSATAPIRD